MQKLLLRVFFTISFIIGVVPSDGQTWAWAKNGNGTGTDGGWAVCSDANGNVYATGYFKSPTITFGSYTLTNTGSWNVFLVKYDVNGNVLWAKGSLGSGEDGGTSVSVDATGNVFITGYFTSPIITFDSYTLSKTANQNVFLVKYDTNGNILFAKSSTGIGDGTAFSVSTDRSGNAYITGNTASAPITFGSFTLAAGNVFLVKYDTNGNVLWATNSVGGGGDIGYSVSTDAAGNVFVTGYFSSQPIFFGSYLLNGSTGWNVFLVKYDTNGNVLWAKSSVGFVGGFGYSVSADANGNAYITGTFISPTITFGTYTLINTGGQNVQNAFLAKYDSNGNVLWAKNVKGISQAYSASANSNNVYISGSFSGSITIDTYTLIAPVDAMDPMFIATFDLNGNATYATCLSSGGDNWNGIAVDKSCNVYIAGDFQGNENFIVGTNTLVPTGTENIFVAKLSMPQPTVTVSSSSDVICVGHSATLSASGASTYSWIPSATGDTLIITPSFPSTYTVIGTNTAGCQNSATIAPVVSICSGIKEFNPNNYQIRVFPNPNNGSFKIQIDNEIDGGELVLTNSLGQKVHEQKIIRGENEINSKGISTGLYQYIIFQNKQQVGNGKLIIE